MDIEKFIAEIIAEKVLATNKDKMALLLDKALTSLKALHDQPLDERSANVVTALQAKNMELQEFFDVHLQEIAAHKFTIDNLSGEITSLTEQLTQQDQETEDLRIQLKEAQEIANDALNSFNTAAVKVADPLEAEVKGKRVKINHGVDLHGKRYTANELADNAKVLEELFEMGSGSITLID